MFVSKEAKLCIEVIHLVTKMEEQEQEGRIVWSFSSFLHHLLNWRYRNSKGQEFCHIEKRNRRLEIVTLVEGSSAPVFILRSRQH